MVHNHQFLSLIKLRPFQGIKIWSYHLLAIPLLSIMSNIQKKTEAH
jgi:hypothetical protein